MKSFLLFFVFLLLGIAVVLSYYYWSAKFIISSTSQITTKFSLKNAPSESLSGFVATISGKVNWQSRTASKFVPVKMNQQIQQGEELTTENNGKVGVKIQNDALILLQPNTHISIIQLLPINLVFVQDKGEAEYTNTIQTPISVRSLDLLSVITKGKAILTVDQKNQTVTVSLLQGTAREGYQDLQGTNNILNLNQGQIFVFDETNKIGTIQ